ncbi:MAG: SAM-dependent methyltransferase [Candidatus Xenobia bacterium]
MQILEPTPLARLSRRVDKAWLASREAVHFLGFRQWWRLQAAMRRAWRGHNPHHVIMEEAPGLGLDADCLIWGETPCITLEAMLRRVQAGPGDVLVDLGCGRGLTVLFAWLRFGMPARGYDVVQTFIARARQVADELGLGPHQVAFHCQDFTAAEIGGGTIYFVPWTTFPEAVKTTIVQRLEPLPPGVQVITLTAAIPSPLFRRIASELHEFSWGLATVWYHERLPAPAGRS